MIRTLVQLTMKPYMLQESMYLIRSARILYVQTSLHPACKWLAEEGISYYDMDDLYASSNDFEELNRGIAERIAACMEDCVYAYTGNIAGSQLPYIRKAIEARGDTLRILPALSGSEIAFPEISADRCIPAQEWDGIACAAETLCFTEVDSRLKAGELKWKLTEYYPDDWKILIAEYSERLGSYSKNEVPLFELDRCTGFDASTSVLVPRCPFFKRTRYGYPELLEILKCLRAPDGCPWDRAQTHATLKDPLLEETYEVIDAIDREADTDLCEELGDLWMNILMQCLIAEEQASFTARDVTTEVVQKLIHRHPHVFGNDMAGTPEEVLIKWDEVKKAEKGQVTQAEALRSVPKAFPALLRTIKVQKRAASAGFEWEDIHAAAQKTEEEFSEVMEALDGRGDLYEECGDYLFASANLVRMLRLNPELALQNAVDKFINRFSRMEEMILRDGKELQTMERKQLLEFWEKAKHS